MQLVRSATRSISSLFSPSKPKESVPHETELASAIGQKSLEAQGNGDFVLTPARSRFYCAVDGVGGVRQVAATTQASAMLATHSTSAVSRIAGAVIPFGLLITGPLVMGSVVKWTLPDAYKALKDAKQELIEAGDDAEKVKEAEHAVSIAKLGVANHYLCFGMGATQTAAGAAMMMTPEVAHTLHYAPVLTGAAANTALAVTNVALGLAYTVRGAVMLYRTGKAYKPVKKISKQFNKALESNPKQALELLKKEEGKGATYFERRVDPNSLEVKDENGNVTGKYTADGLVCLNGKVIDNSVKAKSEYLRRVDKGIHVQLAKHRVALIIGAAMVIGGITAIALTFITGGLAPLVIGLVSAIFFICMEYLFFVYDSTALFDKLCDRTYTPHPALANLEETLKEESFITRAVNYVTACSKAA